jgi:translation initiation factor 2D
MFKKKPEIKNLSPLRSSDRRKLADQIIKDYGIQVPLPQAAEPEDASTAAATLSSVRNSLLPDSTSSARFTTTSGQNLAMVSGTFYVGAHPGEDERVLWFQTGKNPRLIPTVYTLWHNPGIIPLLHTPDFVVEEKLSHGSDLMIPGLVKPRSAPWDTRARAGAIVAVAGLQRDTVPMWVGTCEVDVCSLGHDLRGQKGVAVKGLHWAGDELWSWRSVGSGGRDAPSSVEGWPGLTEDVSKDIGNMTLDDDDDQKGDEQAEGGAALDKPPETAGPSLKDALEVVEDREPTTKEVDEAFTQAFLFAVHKAKTNSSEPHYGFDFPIQASYLISSMIQPHLRYQSPHYNIKKTSWKNAKKFIKHLDKTRLLKSKDRSGGETVILDIDFDDAQVTNFRTYTLPKAKPASSEAGQARNSAAENTSASGDPSIGQKITVQMVYRASSKLVPTLLPSKTEFYTAQQISAALKTYIEERPDLGGQGTPNIKLDPFIANNILGSNPSVDDSRALVTGRISRGALQKRLLDDTHLCQPYHLIVRGGQPTPDQKPKAGPVPHVHITMEKRTGTKVVTKVSNLEPFHIDPQLLAPELQKKCAGSASAGQLTGGKPGLLEVVVQGDQRKILSEVLAKRGIDPKWVEVVDKTKPKKK